MLTATPLLAIPSADEVNRHMVLVKQVVARFLRRLPANVLRDDLVAAGVFGLVDSLRKNGGDRGPTFEAYARIRIRGAILDELRTQDWLSRRARWAVTDKVEAGEAAPMALIGLDDVDAALALVDEDADDAEAQMLGAESMKHLRAAVERLPTREATIVRMHYFHGARFKEIGAALGVSEPRISQLHTRAMGQLRKILAEAA